MAARGCQGLEEEAVAQGALEVVFVDEGGGDGTRVAFEGGVGDGLGLVQQVAQACLVKVLAGK